MKKLFYILFICTLIVACKETSKEKTETLNKENVAVNLQSFQVDIKGMTCEIGCAKLIQSKLYKVNGVKYAKIDFEHNNGVITYNSNKISEKDIVTKIEKIAGGDLYSVTKTTKLDSIIN